jgi:hypothetical protein
MITHQDKVDISRRLHVLESSPLVVGRSPNIRAWLANVWTHTTWPRPANSPEETGGGASRISTKVCCRLVECTRLGLRLATCGGHESTIQVARARRRCHWFAGPVWRPVRRDVAVGPPRREALSSCCWASALCSASRRARVFCMRTAAVVLGLESRGWGRRRQRRRRQQFWSSCSVRRHRPSAHVSRRRRSPKPPPSQQQPFGE